VSDFLFTSGWMLFYGLLVYVAVISLAAAIVTVVDKHRAQRQNGARRVPENTLMLLAALGGAAAMLITMLMIRHKTRHVKFMLGLPIILLFQATLVLYFVRMI